MGERREQYPEIVLTEQERRREELLKAARTELPEAFVEGQDNACALKGGTALRFGTGFPLPSTDLDFVCL